MYMCNTDVYPQCTEMIIENVHMNRAHMKQIAKSMELRNGKSNRIQQITTRIINQPYNKLSID